MRVRVRREVQEVLLWEKRVNSRPLPSDAEQIATMGDAEIAALNREVERLSQSDRRARTRLANMCEAVMTRVVELEEIDSPPCKVIAKKLRAAVVAACD